MDYSVKSVWEVYDEFPELVPPAGLTEIPTDIYAEVQRVCNTSLEDEAKRMEAKGLSVLDRKLVQKLLDSGTFNDKLSALTVRINASPISEACPKGALDELIALCFHANRQRAAAATGVLTDAVLAHMPHDRDLRPLTRCTELLAPNCTKRHAVILAYAAQLRRAFLRMCEAIEALAADTVQHWRLYSVQLLERVALTPHTGSVPLEILGSKFGDADTRVRAAVRTAIQRVLTERPEATAALSGRLMTLVEERKLPLRGIVAVTEVLAQLRLRAREYELAERLVGFCLNLFRLFVEGAERRESGIAQYDATARTQADDRRQRKQKQMQRRVRQNPNAPEQQRTLADGGVSIEGKLVSACLNAVRRFIPYLPPTDTETIAGIQQHVTTLYRTVHVSSIGTASLALQLLAELEMREGAPPSGRLCSAVYQVVSRHEFRGAAAPRFRSLLRVWHQVVSADTDEDRAAAQVRRLLQVAAMAQPGQAAAILVAVDDVCRRIRPSLRSLLAGSVETAQYDPYARDPRGAHAKGSLAWEMTALSRSFHPSLAVFTRQTLDSTSGIDYSGDPILDHRLMAFLDKFASRRAKVRGQSVSARAPFVPPAELARASTRPDEDFFRTYFARVAPRSRPNEVTEDEAEAAIRESLLQQGLVPDPVEGQEGFSTGEPAAEESSYESGSEEEDDDDSAGSAFETVSSSYEEDNERLAEFIEAPSSSAEESDGPALGGKEDAAIEEAEQLLEEAVAPRRRRAKPGNARPPRRRR